MNLADRQSLINSDRQELNPQDMINKTGQMNLAKPTLCNALNRSELNLAQLKLDPTRI